MSRTPTPGHGALNFLHVDGNESQALCPIKYELFIRQLMERLT
jgi:hypothetical protein